jgi:hypothetical protein
MAKVLSSHTTRVEPVGATLQDGSTQVLEVDNNNRITKPFGVRIRSLEPGQVLVIPNWSMPIPFTRGCEMPFKPTPRPSMPAAGI